MERMGIVFGYELIIDMIKCNDKIASELMIKEFALELCKVLDMKPYGEAQTPYFGINSEITKGYSLLQFIETSSITGHFSEHRRSAHLNIFSCKEFDHTKATEFCEKFFMGKIIRSVSSVRMCTDG